MKIPSSPKIEVTPWFPWGYLFFPSYKIDWCQVYHSKSTSDVLVNNFWCTFALLCYWLKVTSKLPRILTNLCPPMLLFEDYQFNSQWNTPHPDEPLPSYAAAWSLLIWCLVRYPAFWRTLAPLCYCVNQLQLMFPLYQMKPSPRIIPRFLISLWNCPCISYNFWLSYVIKSVDVLIWNIIFVLHSQ